MAFALKSLTAAVASAVFLSSAASAAGLGRLTVLSALGQPLRAEIELTSGSGEDPASMAVKLASPEAFRSANIDFNPALLSLRFAVENRGGRQIIRVSSTQPLNEPFVDMLLELSWNNGRLVREYTFLLDPPELRITQPAQVAAAPAAAPAAPATPAAQPRAQAPAPAQTAPEPATPAPATTPAPAPARQAAAPRPRAADADAETPANYRVRRGDTLSGIATRVKPADISLDMMLVALYRANPDAFIGNNMNRLKSGQILSVPDADSVRGGASQGEARGVVVAHAADFDAYRNKLAGQVAASTPAAAAPSGQSASGRVTARVEERPTAANEAQDKLRLSKAESAPAGTPQGGTASVEDTVAKQRELAQAEARVKELEKNVGELENLMTVESRSGAEAQQSAGAKAPAAATAEPAPAAPKPAPRIRPAKPEPAPEEPGLADTIIDNFHYIAAGAAVLLLGALGIAQRRKRKTAATAKPAQAEPSVLGASGPNAGAGAGASLFAESGGQSVDTNNSVFNSSFAPSASQLDTNEVDPVAEADVYIAYGRDAQAEEILKEALRTHPERHAVRLKLLEIYAARKDLRAFEGQARELHGLTRGQGDEWAQAAALGLGIDPTNPLYANAAPAPAPTPSPQERSQQAMLSQQFEDAFRGGAPVAAGAAAGLAAGAAAGTLAHADDERTAAPQDEPAPAPRTDDNGLDFDLNGLNFEPVTAADTAPATGRADPDATAVPDLEFSLDKFDAPAPAAQAKPVDDPNDLDFDMDFDAAPAAAAQPAAPADDDEDDFTLDLSPQSQIQATPVDMAGLAKDFEGLPPLPGSMPQPTTPAASEPVDPLFDLDTMDFGAPATQVAPAAAPFEQQTARPAPAANASEDPLFDLDSMDFGLPSEPKAPASAPAAAATPQDDPFALFDLPETPAPVPAPQEVSPSAMRDAVTGAPVEPSFDLSDFDLDLPPDAAAQPALAGGAEAAAAQMSPEHMEMETKLDLAIAYQEIGDREGARELLDEVIKGGNSEQVSKANAMRELLA
ncbi:FimV/HubP family polar landmark protein [Massilia sp. YIM B02443]|uniref:FimV/HubP family polar landmark protein n=1 Tax=Massilia sp. YIM B02443 TaxID=3050127 RepID=UPI0025B65558|nr:FimV/HubP family polar landmark protein [Massilia sp. YIM B02443]MDN4036238.1 FimV/HubP family polar landmark protein [Massilia sp. YIM B02443]